MQVYYYRRRRNAMKKNMHAFFILISLFSLVCCTKSVSEERAALWPSIEPYQTDYLQVSDLHKIYYEACGNPEGKPVFVLHGGPGARLSPYYRRFFNPKIFHIVLHDQRGTGLSKPFLELRENTTWDLVEDIEKLRKHMKCEKIILFGGSWGSTLALAYAETYPENVSGIVIRGIFTATQEELDRYYSSGVKVFFPEAYARLEKVFGQPVSPERLLKKIQDEDSEKRYDCSKAWAAYESKIAELNISDGEVAGMVNSKQLSDIVRSLGLLENYYMANGCFFEEGQLLDKTSRIKDIPTVLVNGRYDMICPPITAYRLHQLLPLSRLVIVEEAGHSMSEPGIELALLRAMNSFE
jgi:proline iminopeptidase